MAGVFTVTRKEPASPVHRPFRLSQEGRQQGMGTQRVMDAVELSAAPLHPQCGRKHAVGVGEDQRTSS